MLDEIIKVLPCSISKEILNIGSREGITEIRLRAGKRGIVIASKTEKLLLYYNPESSYPSFYELANKSYLKFQKENLLINKLKIIFNNNPNCYNAIYDFFNNIENLEKNC